MIEVKMQMPEPPEGWEYTGEYRPADNDTWADWNDYGKTMSFADADTALPVPIIRHKGLTGKKLVQSWPVGTVYKYQDGYIFCVGVKGVYGIDCNHFVPYSESFYDWNETHENTEILYMPGKE